jgi:beta-lactam-binding protein with PASTA domain
MRGRGWGGWRWAVAGVLIGVLVLGLGVVLRHAQLGGAANVAQIVSLAPLVVGLTGWARSRRKAQDPTCDRPIGLGEMLRTIADAQGLTGEDLRARVRGWGGDTVDAYMDGAELPGWDFVAAFLDVVAGDDRWRFEALERRVRPVWKATADFRPLGDGAGVGVTEQGVVVMRGTGSWMMALRNVASTQRVLDGVQVSIRRHEILRSGLAEMLERLTRAVDSLATERDDLHKALATRQDNSPGGAPGRRIRTEIEDLRSQLRDTQQRLDRAERLQVATVRRLEESERQRRLAERLKVEAMAHAEQARRRLADLDHHTTPVAARADAPPLLAGDAASALMGNTDRQVAEEVLDRVDSVLRDEAEALSQFDEDLTSTPGPRPALLWALSVLVLLAVAGGVAYAMLGRGGDTVPQVKGLSLAQAEKMIRKAGLSYTVQRQPSSVVAQGSVIRTNPVNRTVVPAGAKVTLTVSSGPQKVTVPKVRGTDATQATRKLTGLGLHVHQVQARNSTQPLHTVVSQNPAPGTQVSRDSEVTISVSLGASGVPNVVNEDVNLAKGHLVNAGFTNITIIYLADPNLQNGIVTNQNPPSGRIVLPSTRITLSVVNNQPVSSPAPIFTPNPTPTASPTAIPTPSPTLTGGGGGGGG